MEIKLLSFSQNNMLKILGIRVTLVEMSARMSLKKQEHAMM